MENQPSSKGWKTLGCCLVEKLQPDGGRCLDLFAKNNKLIILAIMIVISTNNNGILFKKRGRFVTDGGLT